MEKKHNKKLVPIAKVLRKNMTKEERRLWYDFLRTYPVRFLRQKIIGNYVVDFYCAKANVIIELDGSGHYTNEGVKSDAERTEFLEKYGLKILRIANNELTKNFKGVCEYIDEFVKQAIPHR